MIYGYLRVSSDEQDVNSQKQGVDDFAKSKQWEIDEYIKDEGVSGGKDPSKRNLGILLDKLKKGDIVICSEISRLGRDLYMVMEILHYAMKTECVIYTVKDNFVLGDDIQSKVLAFAFGLAAEIERQMIRQRTKEGLALRVKNGVLLGRPLGKRSCKSSVKDLSNKKEEVIMQFNWGVPERRLAENFGCDRNTIARWLHRWGVKPSAHIERIDKTKQALRSLYLNQDFCPISENQFSKVRQRVEDLILKDYTIPEIAKLFPEFTYKEIYDTILLDIDLHKSYRQHGQKIAVKKK